MSVSYSCCHRYHDHHPLMWLLAYGQDLEIIWYIFYWLMCFKSTHGNWDSWNFVVCWMYTTPFMKQSCLLSQNWTWIWSINLKELSRTKNTFNNTREMQSAKLSLKPIWDITEQITCFFDNIKNIIRKK